MPSLIACWRLAMQHAQDETTRIFRRRTTDCDDDLDDQAEAISGAFDAGLELAAALVSQDGDRRLAALIRRQKKVTR